MNDSIFDLHSDLSTFANLVGRKAATLNRLALAGYPIPPGLCIGTSHFHAAIAPFADAINMICVTHDLHVPTLAQAAASEIAALLDALALPHELTAQLEMQLPTLGDGAFAVRSSATLEDLPEASFAGQYQSVLGVRSLSDVSDAIFLCWRSFFSAHALAAQAAIGRHDSAHGMAVLIQPLIDAECAGVCFTVDPVHLQAEVMLISAAWGLGSGVVEGRAPADVMRLKRTDFTIVERAIADKHVCIRAAAGAGTQVCDVPEDRRRLPCLSDAWLERVSQLGLSIEQHLGLPQDIEWAIAENKLWLLQSRPITTLPETITQAAHFPIGWTNEAERMRLWWFDGGTYRPSGNLLPAEIDLIQASSAGSQMSVVIGGGPQTRWRKFVNGRSYMARAKSTLSAGEARIRGAAFADLLARLQAQDVLLWAHFGPEVVLATQRLGAFDATSADGSALAMHVEDALAAVNRHWFIHTLLPRMGRFEPLLEVYAQITGKSFDAGFDELPFLSQGAETMQTRCVEMLYELACLAQVQPTVMACLQQRPPDGLARLRQLPEVAEFLHGFDDFMRIYGSRQGPFSQGIDGGNPHLIALPWREAPAHVLDMIARYLPAAAQGETASPRTARLRALREHEARIDAICASTQDAALVALFRKRLDYFRRDAACLDDHNHYIDQLSSGQLSQALIHAGRWLARLGDLPHPYDVFFLHVGEVAEVLRVPAKVDLRSLLAERKAQFDAESRMLTPHYIGLPDDQLPARPPEQRDPDTPSVVASTRNAIHGQAASRGKAGGRARVVTHVITLPDVEPGDVLVAYDAGPIWTPIFPILAGIVLNGSGPGDHAAITAREFGVPMVCNANNATQRIANGVWVTVDGDTGIIAWE